MPREDFQKNPRDILSGNVDPSWRSLDTGMGEDVLFMFLSLARSQGVELDRSKKILELGSGDGSVVGAGKKAGLDIVGVDINPRGQQKIGQVLARIEKLPFADNTFDVVASKSIFDSFVYNQNSEMMGKEIYRVLKKDGIYIGVEFESVVLPKGLAETATKGVYRKI